MFDKKAKQVNVVPSVKDEIFFANQIDMRFFPDLFKIDFKQMNQQVDRIGEEVNNTLIINRRSIALTPMMMKQFSGIVNNIVVNYEKEFGEIKLPKVVKPKKVDSEIVTQSNEGYIG